MDVVSAVGRRELLLSGRFGAEIQAISWTGPGFGMNAGLLKLGYLGKYEQNMNMPEKVFLNNNFQNILKKYLHNHP